MSVETSKRICGFVKWFNASKGYGFIQQPEGEDLFVHYSSIEMDGYKSLDAGVTVEFEIVPDRKPGMLEAKNVVVVDA